VIDVTTYTVRRLAELAGITVRTLHHYDEFGLLRPAARTDSGYRLYGERELLLLQQIMFFRQLDVPLEDIRRILADPRFDQAQALKRHRELLKAQAARLDRLIETIDKTLHMLEGTMTLNDAELYEGFSPEQIERYKRESRESYGVEVVEESERRAKSMTKGQWQAVKDEGDAVTRGLAALMDRQPDDPEVQALIERHYKWVATFWTPDAAAYQGLGQLYTDNPEFRATYDNYRVGLADFLRAAMTYYAEHTLA
jgi:MerR family transcriptional regulator, thiopeptide resistance regulator